MRKRVISGDYRDKEVWENYYETKCNFVWTSGQRNVENKEIFFSNLATVTVRSYVDVQEEDHLRKSCIPTRRSPLSDWPW